MVTMSYSQIRQNGMSKFLVEIFFFLYFFQVSNSSLPHPLFTFGLP